MNLLDGACCDKYPECTCADTAKKVAQKMHELRLQEIAHDKGECCEEDDCQECCPHDERENGYCIGCDHDGNDGSDVDSAYERVRGI